jgi:hypothetical protein
MPHQFCERLPMATITYRPKDHVEGSEEAPEVWGCHVALKEDGSFEVSIKGETGLHMLTAAIDALRHIDRLRAEPRFEFRHEGMADMLSSLKTQISL